MPLICNYIISVNRVYFWFSTSIFRSYQDLYWPFWSNVVHYYLLEVVISLTGVIHYTHTRGWFTSNYRSSLCFYKVVSHRNQVFVLHYIPMGILEGIYLLWWYYVMQWNVIEMYILSHYSKDTADTAVTEPCSLCSLRQDHSTKHIAYFDHVVISHSFHETYLINAVYLKPLLFLLTHIFQSLHLSLQV